jgi:hypothetical protein
MVFLRMFLDGVRRIGMGRRLAIAFQRNSAAARGLDLAVREMIER